RDDLALMPEMAGFCGGRFVVDVRTEKVCDTVRYTGSRRLPRAVFLADLRCDGSAHGGCQAECRLTWKEEWLRKVAPDAPAPAPGATGQVGALLERPPRPGEQPGTAPG